MISRDADARVRDLAVASGLTERAVQSVLGDLEKAGYVRRSRIGRRNHYRIIRGTHFRHPAEARHEITGLLKLFRDLDGDVAYASDTVAGEGDGRSAEA